MGLGEIPQRWGARKFRLRAAPEHAIFVAMRLTRTSRLRRLALGSLLLGLWAGGCYDSPTGSGTKLRLVDPLNVTWRGKANGDSYPLGRTATFSAATNLRAIWHFQIANSAGATYTAPVPDNQDRVEFTWDGRSDDGRPDDPPSLFHYGDHCVATVTFEVLELDPRDAAKALVSFDIQ